MPSSRFSECSTYRCPAGCVGDHRGQADAQVDHLTVAHFGGGALAICSRVQLMLHLPVCGRGALAHGQDFDRFLCSLASKMRLDEDPGSECHQDQVHQPRQAIDLSDGDLGAPATNG